MSEPHQSKLAPQDNKFHQGNGADGKGKNESPSPSVESQPENWYCYSCSAMVGEAHINLIMDVGGRMGACTPSGGESAQAGGESETLKITRREPVTAAMAIAGLCDIFDRLQAPEPEGFHDRWDWMEADFCLEVLRVTIEDLEAPTTQAAAPADLARILAEMTASLADKRMAVTWGTSNDEPWQAIPTKDVRTIHAALQSIAALEGRVKELQEELARIK